MVKIVAIDGPASVGKSTIAKIISYLYNAPVLSSGKLYRAVAVKIKDRGIGIEEKNKIINIAKSLTVNDINSGRSFSSEIDKIASRVSAEKYLRKQLLEYQREFPKKFAKGKKFAIIEGRDIGSHVFPDAKFKIFMWADAKIRAKRRYEQIMKNGQKVSLIRIYNEIIARDNQDMNRKVAPLKPAVNSVLLDTSYLDIEQALNAIKNIINQ